MVIVLVSVYPVYLGWSITGGSAVFLTNFEVVFLKFGQILCGAFYISSQSKLKLKRNRGKKLAKTFAN